MLNSCGTQFKMSAWSHPAAVGVKRYADLPPKIFVSTKHLLTLSSQDSTSHDFRFNLRTLDSYAGNLSHSSLALRSSDLTYEWMTFGQSLNDYRLDYAIDFDVRY